MVTKTLKSRKTRRVTQFSVFTPNRLGRLNDLVGSLATRGIHVLAMMVLDTTDSAIIRVVVNDPDGARELLDGQGFPFTESDLVSVEVTAAELSKMMAVLLQAEININYMYSFIPSPGGKSLVGLSMEDNDLAEQALNRHGFRTLLQADVSR